ncbi:hypothetical protein [Streptomyces sp. NPDC002054]|uniref:hypothetical protein n=1 Tax=Streptomyces sp. NPDC002054 TaxID=3154663 RepID=UPI00332BB697
MSTPALAYLGAQLDAPDAATVLAAVWDTLTLITELADATAFEEGSDELQAMAAAQRCSQARDLLPLPTGGEPVAAPVPAAGAAGLDPDTDRPAPVRPAAVVPSAPPAMTSAPT